MGGSGGCSPRAKVDKRLAEGDEDNVWFYYQVLTSRREGLFARGNIFSAIERGNVRQCRELLRDDPAILSQTDELGRAPLHVAAHKRSNEIVALLLAAGADPRSRDANGGTALHWAAVGGDPQVVETLVAAGVDINAVDKDSLTPGQLARMRGHEEIAVLLGHP